MISLLAKCQVCMWMIFRAVFKDWFQWQWDGHELSSFATVTSSGMNLDVCVKCVDSVCACLRRCVYLSVTLRSYITPPNRKARGSLQRAQYEPSTAADGMSLSYLALYSFTSPSPSVSLPLVDACPSPGPPLREISQKTHHMQQNL